MPSVCWLLLSIVYPIFGRKVKPQIGFPHRLIIQFSNKLVKFSHIAHIFCCKEKNRWKKEEGRIERDRGENNESFSLNIGKSFSNRHKALMMHVDMFPFFSDLPWRIRRWCSHSHCRCWRCQVLLWQQVRVKHVHVSSWKCKSKYCVHIIVAWLYDSGVMILGKKKGGGEVLKVVFLKFYVPCWRSICWDTLFSVVWLLYCFDYLDCFRLFMIALDCRVTSFNSPWWKVRILWTFWHGSQSTN